MNEQQNENSAASGWSDSKALLATLPWHVGFHNQIADMLRDGDWQPDLVRYNVVQICDNDGRHVCWAKSADHAALIVDAVNRLGG